MPEKKAVHKRMKTVVEETKDTPSEVAQVKEETVQVPEVVSPVQNPAHIITSDVSAVPSSEVMAPSIPVENMPSPQAPLVSPVETQSNSESSSKLKIVLIVLLVLALLALIGGGVYTYIKGMKKIETPKSQETPTVEPTKEVQVTAAPSPTTVPTAKLSSYKISVLNGSGVVGVAGKVKSLLETAGFKVANTGNAKTYDFTDTTIQVKKNVSQGVIESATKALTGYLVSKGDNLADDNGFDIIVTVGSKKD